MSEDFVWVRHSNAELIGREVLVEWFMSDEYPKSENNKIIYENNEIGVAHSFDTFTEGLNLQFSCIHNKRRQNQETGATKMPEK